MNARIVFGSAGKYGSPLDYKRFERLRRPPSALEACWANTPPPPSPAIRATRQVGLRAPVAAQSASDQIQRSGDSIPYSEHNTNESRDAITVIISASVFGNFALPLVYREAFAR